MLSQKKYALPVLYFYVADYSKNKGWASMHSETLDAKNQRVRITILGGHFFNLSAHEADNLFFYFI